MIRNGMITVSVAEFVSHANGFKTYAEKKEWSYFWSHVKYLLGKDTMLQLLGECKNAAEGKEVSL